MKGSFYFLNLSKNGGTSWQVEKKRTFAETFNTKNMKPVLRKIALNASLLFFLCLSLAFSCNRRLLPYLDIDKQVRSMAHQSSIKAEDLAKDTAWDSLLIVKPYADIDSYPVKLPKIDREELKQDVMKDIHCSLIFFSNGKAVGYTKVSRDLKDFSFTEKDIYGREEEILFPAQGE